MILWSVRHAGSPESVDGLTADDIIDGVREDIWDPSDEVMGPDDPDWGPLDQHPVFAQAMPGAGGWRRDGSPREGSGAEPAGTGRHGDASSTG